MEDIKILENEIRSRYASVVWSHKIQEKQADIYAKKYKYMEIANIACASLTSVGIVSLIFTDQLWIKLASAVLSFVPIFISTYFKSFDLKEFTKLHRKTATKLLEIRDKIELLLMEIKLKNISIDIIEQKFNETMDSLHKIYDEAPETTNKAVKKARKALKVTKDNTFTDGEIDSFLPEGLRKS